MQQTRSVEIGTGLFVLLGMSALFFMTTQTTGGEKFSATDTFEVEASFDNVGSLKPRAPVSMSGVTIGRVTGVVFDPVALVARVTLIIDSQYSQIPDDSDASILTSGLLGSQYIGLQAGGSVSYLENGSEIYFTQSLLRRYANGLLEFDQERVSVLPFRGDESKPRAKVKSTVVLNDGTKVAVDYELVKREEGWLLFNVVIEGISYIRNFRTELDSEIRGSSLDAVIERLEGEAGI